MLADHCSQSINIRLTSDGYITADWHMDMPPMRCVLLDPYTGWASHDHHMIPIQFIHGHHMIPATDSKPLSFFQFLCQTVRYVFPGKLQNNTSTNDLLTSVLSQESCMKEIEVACTMYINHFVFVCRNRTMQESRSYFFISFTIHINFKNIPSCLGQHECLSQTAVLLSL